MFKFTEVQNLSKSWYTVHTLSNCLSEIKFALHSRFSDRPYCEFHRNNIKVTSCSISTLIRTKDKCFNFMHIYGYEINLDYIWLRAPREELGSYLQINNLEWYINTRCTSSFSTVNLHVHLFYWTIRNHLFLSHVTFCPPSSYTRPNNRWYVLPPLLCVCITTAVITFHQTASTFLGHTVFTTQPKLCVRLSQDVGHVYHLNGVGWGDPGICRFKLLVQQILVRMAFLLPRLICFT